jgi:hypothetical protein
VLYLIGITRARVALGAFALASMAACAQAGTSNPVSAATDQFAPAGQICQTVVRVKRGEAHYAACVSSLSDTPQSAGDVRAVRRDVAIGNAADMQAPKATRSYFYASPHEVFRRVQLSCARLGFDPANGAFTNCDGNLAAALNAIDAPY